MGYNIKFSVHKNPLKDDQGNETYQVRQETHGTVGKEWLLHHLKTNNLFRPELMESALIVLESEIIEQLTSNLRLHLEGLGSFYLKLGLRKRYDELGNEIKAPYTDPSNITGNDVFIEGIGFTPDKQFLSQLHEHGYHFTNATGKGNVGHSAQYTEEQMKARLDEWFEKEDYITRRQMQFFFGLTKYMASKWLDQLSSTPSPYLSAQKIGKTVIYSHSKRT